jgi:fructokinase
VVPERESYGRLLATPKSGWAGFSIIEARWGTPAAELPPDHPAWDTEAWYLAHGALSLPGIVSPERIIIGSPLLTNHC